MNDNYKIFTSLMIPAKYFGKNNKISNIDKISERKFKQFINKNIPNIPKIVEE